MEELFALLEWPAMAITLAAAWWMGSTKASKRIVAFIMLIVGNLMWIAWGYGDGAWALIALNVGLMALNVRAIMKNEDEVEKKDEHRKGELGPQEAAES